MSADIIVLDDGEFYIDLNVNYPAETAPGFLSRRCAVGVTTPGGFECIGSFDKQPNGTWSADVQAHYDSETDSDCLVVAVGVSRMDAIVALWAARRSAVAIHR